jgi:guanine deaminase
MVVLDARATPAMAHRMESVGDLAAELALLITLGDARCVRETYVAGAPAKSSAAVNREAGP